MMKITFVALAPCWFRTNVRCQASLKNFGERPLRYDTVLYQFIEDVPEENARCELDCREHQCTEREWIMCRHRLSKAVAESRRSPPFFAFSPWQE